MYNFRCPYRPPCVFVVFVILWNIFKILCLLSYKWWSIRLQMSNGYFNPRVAHGHPVVIEWSYAAFKCWLVPPIPWNDTPNCLQTQHFNFFGKIWFCLFIMSIRFEKYSVGYGEYKCSISLRYLTVGYQCGCFSFGAPLFTGWCVVCFLPNDILCFLLIPC
jgi:hypothetical protein